MTASAIVLRANLPLRSVRRRVWLAVNLQIVQEFVGIGVITVYAPTVFAQAGFSENKSALLSGINDLTYAAAVWVAVLTLDRVGRKPTLYIGAIVSSDWPAAVLLNAEPS